MSAIVILEEIINFTIRVFSFWFSFNIYILIQFIFNSIGIYGILFDFQFFGSDIIRIIMMFLLLLSTIYLCFVSALLFWIFVFWMIILIFVPHIMLIPIPFIPFILPIPLKNILLTVIPPFKLLTKRGILPLIAKLVFLFLFSEKTIREKIGNTIGDVYGFLFLEIKNSIGDFLNLIGVKLPEKPEQSENENHKIRTVDDGTANEARAKKELENNERALELINEEYEICYSSKQTLKTPNTSFIDELGDIKNYGECYSRSAGAYIENIK
jgi:hypothetical protein